MVVSLDYTHSFFHKQVTLTQLFNTDFTDHKYKVWRQAMFNMLKSELDYPLLPPSDLMAFINEETCT